MKKYERKEIDYPRAKEKALRLLEFRNHSSGELRKKLQAYGAKEEDIETVIDFLTEYNLINDTEYAKMLSRDLKNIKRYGTARIRSELYTKGITSEIIDEALGELPEYDFDELVEMVQKRLKGNFEKKNKDKIIRHFITKGYSFDEIKKAVSAVEESNLTEES